jgi:hypothetical protein
MDTFTISETRRSHKISSEPTSYLLIFTLSTRVPSTSAPPTSGNNHLSLKHRIKSTPLPCFPNSCSSSWQSPWLELMMLAKHELGSPPLVDAYPCIAAPPAASIPQTGTRSARFPSAASRLKRVPHSRSRAPPARSESARTTAAPNTTRLPRNSTRFPRNRTTRL